MTMEETKNEKNGSNIKPVNVWKLGIQVVVMLLLIGVLIYMCVTSVIRYSRWPIYTETKTVPQNEAIFPAMTFCALPNGYKEDVLKVSLWIMLLPICYSYSTDITDILNISLFVLIIGSWYSHCK